MTDLTENDNPVAGLAARIRARLDADEQWALAASAPHRYAEGNPPVPPGGVHWEWVGGENNDPAIVDPVIDEFVHVGDDWGVNLASVETWYSGRWDMRALVANEMVEVQATAAGHIARHDPARVLATVAALRTVVDIIERELGDSRAAHEALTALARIGDDDG
jgi:hypothetical protein